MKPPLIMLAAIIPMAVNLPAQLGAEPLPAQLPPHLPGQLVVPLCSGAIILIPLDRSRMEGAPRLDGGGDSDGNDNGGGDNGGHDGPPYPCHSQACHTQARHGANCRKQGLARS